MLIYNHKKEFIGIDKNDVEALGYSNLEQLLQESADFADLFVKSPGYIHNFKHVHWIDFIACAESNEDAKVIINAKGRNYKAVLDIETIYLVQNPTKKSYIIRLNGLRALTQQENEQISGDLMARPLKKTPAFIAPEPEEEEEEAFIAPIQTPSPKPQSIEPEVATPVYKESPNVMHDPYDSGYEDMFTTPQTVEEESYPQEEIAPITLPQEAEELFAETAKPQKAEETKPLHVDLEDDFKLDLEELAEEAIETPQPEAKAAAPKAKPKAAAAVDDDFDNTYVYDPKVASEELGLPIDLIEEFIQDFIAQANEFKEPLYKSLDENDIDNVRVLSHKLKGVAANLRIEDAFNVLVTINTASDINVISLNLNRFYKIIAKLSGEEVAEAPVQEAEVEETDDFFEAPQIEETFQEEPAVSMETTPEFEIEEPVEVAPSAPLEETASSYDIEDDLYMDSFEPKEVGNVTDADVPSKINVPELADDDYNFDDAFGEPSFKEEIPNTPNTTIEETPLDLDFKEDDFVLEAQIPAPVTKNPTPTASVNYNKLSAAREIGLDQESFNELFQNYMDESSHLMKALDTAVVNNDPQMWKKIAVNLKGMSDNMRLNDISKDLEAIITSDDAHSVTNTINSINSKLAMISSIED
ncbi:MAG: Hpt domain-containing protein [Thiovulaceae bacterium]|nr:Hpt domain-containing protein [Sulfurimonadaceae bacterium]